MESKKLTLMAFGALAVSMRCRQWPEDDEEPA